MGRTTAGGSFLAVVLVEPILSPFAPGPTHGSYWVSPAPLSTGYYFLSSMSMGHFALCPSPLYRCPAACRRGSRRLVTLGDAAPGWSRTNPSPAPFLSPVHEAGCRPPSRVMSPSRGLGAKSCRTTRRAHKVFSSRPPTSGESPLALVGARLITATEGRYHRWTPMSSTIE
jgi:hypothetical protein